MSTIAPKLGYKSIAANTLIKTGPAGFFGVISTATGGAITVYDNTTNSGTILFSKTLAVGDVVHFGGNGIAAANGLYVVITGTAVIMYT